MTDRIFVYYFLQNQWHDYLSFYNMHQVFTSHDVMPSNNHKYQLAFSRVDRCKMPSMISMFTAVPFSILCQAVHDFNTIQHCTGVFRHVKLWCGIHSVAVSGCSALFNSTSYCPWLKCYIALYWCVETCQISLGDTLCGILRCANFCRATCILHWFYSVPFKETDNSSLNDGKKPKV